jgi:hypothetical protein
MDGGRYAHARSEKYRTLSQTAIPTLPRIVHGIANALADQMSSCAPQDRHFSEILQR